MVEAKHWVERLARSGFVAKGAVYLILGGLALQAALGWGGQLTDLQGAVRALRVAPFGRLLLALLAIGLAWFALWRFLEAFADVNRLGRGAPALSDRTGYGLSGGIYSMLAIDAARLAAAQGGSTNPYPALDVITRSPIGQAALAIAALVLIGYAVKQLLTACGPRLSENLNQHAASRGAGEAILIISRAGIAGRAAVFALTGVLVLRASFSRPAAATRTDTADSLRWLAALPYGQWLLGASAVALMAYGVYMFVHAKYREIKLA